MKLKQLERRVFGDMTALWYLDEENHQVDFTLIPTGMEDQIPEHREDFNDAPCVQGLRKALDCKFPAYHGENAIQFKLACDPYGCGFSAGDTLRNSISVTNLKKYEFKSLVDGIALVMFDERGLTLSQSVRWRDGEPFVRIATSVTNTGSKNVTLDYLAAFSLGLLSMFQKDDGIECYDLLRWRSNWSNEGRLEQRSVEELGLERSWSGYGVRALRFGERGSMPVKGFFPQVGFYDHKAGVIWGAALDVMSSWELEVGRQGDFFHLSGGYVDREFSQWQKVLVPGETLTSPEAAVTCAKGDAETLQNRLSVYSDEACPASEEDLPVMFNDWCTSWGKPYPDVILPIADKLAGRGIRYFVLDDGWFRYKKDPEWHYAVGDWKVSPEYGPDGIRGLTDQLRKKGFIPGIWFEMEVVTSDAVLFKEHPEMLLHMDGEVLMSGWRTFFDFRRDDVVEYLTEKVIHFLRDNGFGYMKVDYNGPTGFGCDGNDSKSEALRQQTLGIEKFYRKLHQELPELVLEICSSGGHRLTAAWMRQASMGSFSDAHEGVEIPIIAANTANLIPVRKNQIWAVLHPEDDEKRFFYSLSAGLLGRLCLSGDIAHLSAEQFGWVDRVIALYHKAVPVLRDGKNHVDRQIGLSYTAPKGHQVFFREGGSQKLVVVHTFEHSPDSMEIPLENGWVADDIFAPSFVNCEVSGSSIRLGGLTDFTGLAVLLKKA